jgi:hypothetical protein
MSVSVSTTNKPLNPRAQDLSPKGYNRAALYSGKALDFDGVNDSIDISNFSLNGYTAFSICFYKLTDTSASRWVFGNSDSISDGVNIYQNADGTIRSRINALNFDTTNNHFKTNGFFVFTYNGTKGDWFVNGQSESTTTQAAQTLSITSGAKIAVPSYTTGSYYDGQLSGVKVFNTALTAAQVADLYLNPEKIVPDGVANSALKLWLPMMEGAGTTAYDGSGNGNDGTISGATWVSGVGAPVAQTALVSWNKGTNSILWSEQMNNWGPTNTTVTTNVLVSPDGYQNADTIVINDSTSRVSQNLSLGAGTYTASVYAKLTSGSGTVRINLIVDGVQTAFTFTPTNEWERYTHTVTAATGVTAIQLRGSAGTPTVAFWGASLEQSTTAGPYVRTGATAQTSPVLLPQGLTANKDITGVNAFESARNPYALNLDGASWGEVHDNASLDVTDEVSVECWAYWDTSDTIASGIFGKWTAANQCYLLYKTNAGNGIRFYINGSAVGAGSLTDGWHHIVGTYDRTKKRLYIDGVQVNFNDQVDAIGTSSLPLEIGRYDQQPSYGYEEPIALPRIYNRALTATEVARNYNADRSKFGL